MPFTLPALPYAYDALQPHISKATLQFHHDKHHRHYVDTLNKLIKDTKFASASLEEIIQETADKETEKEIFNNAGQTWNHNFYWQCMAPYSGGAPTGAAADLIKSSIVSPKDFAEAFAEAGKTQFGSGWAWLVLDQGALRITKTGNADLPLAHGQVALLTVDVWEHAYYLDVQNEREAYIETFLTHLVNWDFVNANIAEADRHTRANFTKRARG